jgi:hypothetical protein
MLFSVNYQASKMPMKHSRRATLTYYRKRVAQADGVAFFALRPLKK